LFRLALDFDALLEWKDRRSALAENNKTVIAARLRGTDESG
jgi:hypothetical protein